MAGLPQRRPFARASAARPSMGVSFDDTAVDMVSWGAGLLFTGGCPLSQAFVSGRPIEIGESFAAAATGPACSAWSPSRRVCITLTTASSHVPKVVLEVPFDVATSSRPVGASGIIGPVPEGAGGSTHRSAPAKGAVQTIAQH